jgi:hypothetical protein
MSDPMPADLKKVAREIAYKCTEVVESRLQTLVAEVRAQAMEEAANRGFEDHLYYTGAEIKRLFRRRASGKDEE